MAGADSDVGTRRRTGQPARNSGASRLPARGETADEQRALRAGRQAARARPALHRSLPRRPPGVGRARAVRAHVRRSPDDLLHLLHARPDPGRALAPAPNLASSIDPAGAKRWECQPCGYDTVVLKEPVSYTHLRAHETRHAL